MEAEEEVGGLQLNTEKPVFRPPEARRSLLGEWNLGLDARFHASRRACTPMVWACCSS